MQSSKLAPWNYVEWHSFHSIAAYDIHQEATFSPQDTVLRKCNHPQMVNINKVVFFPPEVQLSERNALEPHHLKYTGGFQGRSHSNHSHGFSLIDELLFKDRALMLL